VPSARSTKARKVSDGVDDRLWAKTYAKVKRWPGKVDRVIERERTVVRPSRSFAVGFVPAIAPVTNPLDPDGVAPSCLGPLLQVDAGLL
jgi:hypothetical protein